MLTTNPWRSIWFSPRETVKAMSNPAVKQRFVLFSFIYGFLAMLSAFQGRLFEELFSERFIETFGIYAIPALLLISLILAIPCGAIMITLWSVFLYLGGRVLKGEAGYMDVRRAFSFSQIPYVVSIIGWLAIFIAYGSDVIMPDFGTDSPTSFVILLMLTTAFAISIWSLVILLASLSEMEKFSILKAFGAYLFAVGIWLVIALIVWFGIDCYVKPAAIAFLER